jgi:site-specific DNA-methyltransferase (adenine-specific)
MALAIEAAGFEIRDELMWLYGTGLPRCEDLGKQTGRPNLKGWRRSLKPAHEPIVLARKPLSESSVAANMIKHFTGALNIEGCSPGGKYAANVIHDGVINKPFFYCAKASPAERADTKHPTVKPLDVMRWLVRLVTYPGGKVLDPFAGTGTTLEAALLEGMRPTGIEKKAEYWPDIERRLQNAIRT